MQLDTVTDYKATPTRLCALVRLYLNILSFSTMVLMFLKFSSSNFIDLHSHPEHLHVLSHSTKPLEIPETSNLKISPGSDFENL